MPDKTNPESQTHLSVIMFSDIVGYSKKMQENEDLTMDLLSRHNKIVRDALKKTRWQGNQNDWRCLSCEFYDCC